MHLPIPCTPSVEFNLIGFSSRIPSLCSTLLFFVVAFFVVFVARFAYSRTTSSTSVAVEDKGEKEQNRQEIQQKKSFSPWGFFTLESLPLSLPVTLTAPPNTTLGRGIGLNGAVLTKTHSDPSSPNASQPRPLSDWQSKRGGPAFDRPVAAIYQSQEPASMAKMIMSRHTFRRPSQKPPRRATSLPPASSSRPQSMV